MLTFMRGCPGSGKSTAAARLAAELSENCAIYSTDDFWLVDGEYKFDPTMLDEAHGWNQKRVRAALLENPARDIIIDNCNTKLAEMQPYLAFAEEFGKACYQYIPPDMNLVFMNWHWGTSRHAKQTAIVEALRLWERCKHKMPFHQLFKKVEEFEITDDIHYVTLK